MIKYDIKKSKHFYQIDKSMFISFKYDENIVKLIKCLPTRFYHVDTKQWEVPYNNDNYCYIENLIKRFNGGLNSNTILHNYIPIDKKSLLNDVIIPDYLKFKIPLFEHQLDTIKFGILKNSFILGDEMGLGKTASIIHYGIYKKINNRYKHCLIISGINSLKYNWEDEVKKHSFENGFILGSKIDKNGNIKIGNSNKIIEDINNINDNNNYFIITNIESLRNKKILNALIRAIKKEEINMVVVDEAQCIKNPKTAQSKAVMELHSRTKIAMTGTPIMNNPLELYTIFNWLGLENHSFWTFTNHYAIKGGYQNYEIVGYKNLHEIQYKLDITMLRRLKESVLDLPDKIYSTELLEMGSKQLSIYNEIKKQILHDIDKIKLMPNPLTGLLRLRQATATTSLLSTTINESIKFERLKEIASELKLQNRKFAVFSNWKEIINILYNDILKEYNPSIITGDIKDEHRMKEIGRFNSEADVNCIVGTTGAMGVGFNLTIADTVIFLDSPWNKSLKEQACDRIHRIGQNNNCNIITLACKNTIDEKIENLIYKKGLISDIIVDNNFDNIINKSEVLDFLLN